MAEGDADADPDASKPEEIEISEKEVTVADGVVVEEEEKDVMEVEKEGGESGDTADAVVPGGEEGEGESKHGEVLEANVSELREQAKQSESDQQVVCVGVSVCTEGALLVMRTPVCVAIRAGHMHVRARICTRPVFLHRRIP